jgi:hypothetical protein
MKLITECVECGREMTVDVLTMMETIISCVETGNTFAGALCDQCAEESSEDDKEYLCENCRAKQHGYHRFKK